MSPRRGKALLALGTHQCRFPMSGAGDGALFCAAEIAPGDWLPGRVGGSYCRHHRMLSQGRGTESERSADRVLEALG